MTVEGPFAPQPRSRKPHIGLIVLALFFVLPGLALIEFTGHNAYDFDWRLSRDPVKATARATEFRTLESGPGSKVHTETYELRYAFSIPGDDTTYHATSTSMFDKGDDLWIDVPKGVWDDARESHEIKIEYLKSDPRISQPVKAHRGSITSIVLGSAGVLMAVIGLLLVWGGLRPLWRATSQT